MNKLLKYSIISMSVMILGQDAKAAFSLFKKKEVSPTETMRNNAGKLFPGITIGCSANLVKPFDHLGLVKYLVDEQSIFANPKSSIPDKKKASDSIKKIFDYVGKLAKCSASPTDPNFNKLLAQKYVNTQACNVPLNITKSTIPGQMAKQYQTLLNNLYSRNGSNSLCKTAQATGAIIAQNNTVAQIKKELGVPSGVMAKATYLGFAESLTTSLTAQGVGQKMMTWYKLDQKGFDTHFNLILKGVTAKGQNTVNLKAVGHTAKACAGDFGRIKIPVIQEICKNAMQTNQQNDLNGQVSKIKSALGIPSFGPVKAIVAKSCSPMFIQKLNPQAIEEWQGIDMDGATEYLDTLGKCFSGKKLHPKMSQFIQNVCDKGLSNINGAQSLCAKATEQVTTISNNMMGNMAGMADKNQLFNGAVQQPIDLNAEGSEDFASGEEAMDGGLFGSDSNEFGAFGSEDFAPGEEAKDGELFGSDSNEFGASDSNEFGASDSNEFGDSESNDSWNQPELNAQEAW